MNKNEFKVDAYGQLLGMPCHDGLLNGIDVSRKSIVEMKISSSEGVNFIIIMKNVKFFVTNNFIEGNIIDRMYFWSLEETPNQVLSNLLKSFGLSTIDDLLPKSSKNIYVFTLESSYGAECFAVLETELDKSDCLRDIVFEELSAN